MRASSEKLYRNLPETPGVYLMRGGDKLLYVGKAANLKRRVSSYFLRPHDARLERLVALIERIDYQRTDTAIEALILEAKLIKENAPPFNIREKDDKSFLYVEITGEKFPRVILVRGKDATAANATEKEIKKRKLYGPFTSAASVRGALKIIRRIFPFNTHAAKDLGRFERPCFDAQIGLCPGTCVGAISLKEYRKSVKNIVLFFEGKKERILKNLEREMGTASRKLDFEKATQVRRQIFSLRHIQDIAFISENPIGDADNGKRTARIEGYDISNISGLSAVGSMVVFTDGMPDKAHYRKFAIREAHGPDDTGMLAEVLRRRFRNDWPHPDLILIDGGRGQVSAARKVLREFNLKIPLVGLAKGPERKRNDLIGAMPPGVELATLIRVRDEAHRFAIAYHKKVRGRNFYS